MKQEVKCLCSLRAKSESAAGCNKTLHMVLSERVIPMRETSASSSASGSTVLVHLCISCELRVRHCSKGKLVLAVRTILMRIASEEANRFVRIPA